MCKARRTLFFLQIFVCLAFIQTELAAQTITIQKSKISVGKVLKEITAQSGIHFSYNPKSIDTKQKISFFVKNVSLEKALEQLANQIPIEYSIIENQIVLNHKEFPIIEEIKTPKFYTLSGFVNDTLSGESLIGASIFVRGTPRGTITNAFGFYSLQMPKDAYNVEYSYIGFETYRSKIQLDKNKKKDVKLRYITEELPSIIVKIPLQDLLIKKQPGALELSPIDLENMPEFGGESGLIKGIQSLPGIKSHSDGSAFFFVRGGEKDQNLIIIDDAPIYNPSHLFGFYSMVIPDFTKSIKIYKNDIPVNLGDRLSSIIDIRTKDGNLNKFEFSAAFNPLLYRFSVEGPVAKGKSSFFASYRHSSFQWLFKRTAPENELRFSDFNFKWNWKINDKNRMFFTVISGSDALITNSSSANISGIGWNNFASTIRWNHIFSPKLFSNTILYTGNYKYRLYSGENQWHSGIAKLSLKSDFTYFLNSNLTTKFGLELNGFYFNPGQLFTESANSLFPTLQQSYSRQSVLYFNTEYKLSEKWRFNAGLRASNWSNLGPTLYYTFDDNYELLDSVKTGNGVYQNYAKIDPRLSLQYNIDSTSFLKLSYGIYHQYMQLISNSASPFTSVEVWLPSSPNIKPQRANQVALGYLKYFPKKKIEISGEVYYKNMDNQIDYKPHANTLLNPFVEGELRFGQLKSYGLEVMLKKNFGRLNGWISYTYSRALLKTEDVNEGREYPAFQDRPHDFSIMLNYKLKRRVLFSAYWTAYTGSAFSSPTGFYTFNNVTVPIYGEKNNDRLPDYNRLDIAFKFILNRKPESRFQHSLTFSIYNVLAHKNVVAVNFNKVLDPSGTPAVKANYAIERNLIATQTDLIRFLPSLTYKFNL
jgi:TonB dependent receptor-like, beta-barrel/CarboxypepD_reg-like domain/Secretin and TonB N terminus short domain